LFRSCESLELNGSYYCEWNYNGLGLDYQILAGPSFIAIFTIVGVLLGIAADRYNRCVFDERCISHRMTHRMHRMPVSASRVRMLAICTMIFSVAIILSGAVKEYWQLVILRMIQAGG
jgi:MFS family permease